MTTYQKITLTAPLFSIAEMECFSNLYKGIVTFSIHEKSFFINGMIDNDLRSQIINEMDCFFDGIKVWDVVTEDDD